MSHPGLGPVVGNHDSQKGSSRAKEIGLVSLPGVFRGLPLSPAERFGSFPVQRVSARARPDALIVITRLDGSLKAFRIGDRLRPP
jgi:hypothetical protein